MREHRYVTSDNTSSDDRRALYKGDKHARRLMRCYDRLDCKIGSKLLNIYERRAQLMKQYPNRVERRRVLRKAERAKKLHAAGY